jgi:ssDNA thymidine ADP-ribosyltransferase, DarT
MAGINYLDGSIYHMAHLDTAKGIIQRCAILAKTSVQMEKIPYRSIANDEVQDFRNRIFIWDFSQSRYNSLHSYVPFYFATRPPMLHNMFTRGIQDEIVIFEVDRSILRNQGVLFTDGNASIQQLSKSEGEKVGIIPATVKRVCERKYHPGGPYGMGLNHSDFYSDTALLDQLDWDGINNKRRIEPVSEYVRIRHAEVLVLDIVPLGRVQGIYARTQEVVYAVNVVIEDCGFTGRIPSAIKKIDLYY